jgi:hypothetical protein
LCLGSPPMVSLALLLPLVCSRLGSRAVACCDRRAGHVRGQAVAGHKLALQSVQRCSTIAAKTSRAAQTLGTRVDGAQMLQTCLVLGLRFQPEHHEQGFFAKRSEQAAHWRQA